MRYVNLHYLQCIYLSSYDDVVIQLSPLSS